MRRLKLFVTVLFVILVNHAYGHWDKKARPNVFRFIYQNNDTLVLDNPSDLGLKAITQDMFTFPKTVLEVQAGFESGETLHFKYDGTKLVGISVSYKKKQATVPAHMVDMLSNVLYHKLVVFWDGHAAKPFQGSFFYIQLEIGKDKSFDKYPLVKLKFTGKRFWQMHVCRQTSTDKRECVKYKP